MRRSKPITSTPAEPAIAAETPSSSTSSPASDPKEAAAAAIEAAAAAGNLKACKMVADGVPQRLRGIDTEAQQTMEPHVAAAMIAAGLLALDLGPERAEEFTQDIYRRHQRFEDEKQARATGRRDR